MKRTGLGILGKERGLFQEKRSCLRYGDKGAKKRYKKKPVRLF
jgi:hypothetical protein